MKYKHIVFDIDGTLINSNLASLLSLQKTFHTIKGYDISLESLNFSVGLPGDKVLQKLGFEDIIYADYIWQKYYCEYLPQIHVFSGIDELLLTLNRKKYILGVITSRTRKDYENEFLTMDIGHYFNISICYDDCIHCKPSPEPIYRYIDRARILNENMLYIGDSILDFRCARSANVDFAYAGWNSREVFPSSVDYYLNTPKDLLRALGEII